MPATTIDEVLSTLEGIITTSIKTNDRVGYFAALYFKVTSKVKEGIEHNQFVDPVRMEKLDVTFANRYLDAYESWKKNEPVTKSWKIAFDCTKKSRFLVLQHLLLGINAHINLDLGIAAAEITKDTSIQDIRGDFTIINAIISSLTYQVINEIDRFSPFLSLLGLHATKNTSVLIQFSIDNARDGAWYFAEDLSTKNGTDYVNAIKDRDTTILKLANGLIQSKGIMRFTIFIIRIFEWKRPGRIIGVLHEFKKQNFVINNPEKTK